MRLLSIFCCLILASAFVARADDSIAVRPTLAMWTVDAGYASIHDTYLTPITYQGWDLALGFEATRAARFAPGRWLWQLQVGVDYNYTENHAGNNQLYKLLGDISFDMQRRWRDVFTPRLDMSVGPMAQVRAGVIYNPANSNNTVSARAHVNAGIAGMASWRSRLGRMPITLRYQVQLPVVGVFFAPEYDESYYEIYLGNRRNLAHVGWWGNRLDMTNYLGADLHLGTTILRIGYRGRIEHWNVNNLKVHDVSHALVLGIGANLTTVK